MLVRDRKHPYGYHVDRHPPRRIETVTHWLLVGIVAIGFCLILLLQRYSNFL